MRKQKGFTLIELLVVIGILASLAAVAIPTYARFFGQQLSQNWLIGLQVLRLVGVLFLISLGTLH